MNFNNIYYHLRPLIPRRLQIGLRRKVVQKKRQIHSDIWPINEKAGKLPDGWSGWPEGKQFALVLTHDVDTEKGHRNCLNLMKIEKQLGFRSSFNFVPERYKVSNEIRNQLTQNGFEVGVHGLYPDGKLYMSRRIFRERATKINQYIKEWNASGFYSPSMHNNMEWAHDLNIKYDASTFDTDPFEPQSEGVKTIFPFWVSNESTEAGYVELPYSLPQDFTLFVLMKETNIDIWKKKLDWIAEKGGMALITTHPDYMNFGNSIQDKEEYPVALYTEFLGYIKEKYNDQYWHVLPKEIAYYWYKNYGGK